MTLSRKEQWIAFWVTNGLIISLPLLFLLYNEIFRDTILTKCFLFYNCKLYCPGCGGTRAFEALCRFDILESIRYHPVVIYLAGALTVYEFVMIRGLIKKTERKMFFNFWVCIIFIIVFLGYSILRNVLLAYGIDIIGSVLVE